MTFEEDLSWESKAREPLVEKTVNVLNVGFNRWATIEEEKTIHFDFILMNDKTVEIKARNYERAMKRKYYNDKDVGIEIISNTERNTLGWIFNTKADYLAYGFIDKHRKLSRYNLFYFYQLQKWWIEVGQYNGYDSFFGKTGDLYKTENKSVSLKDIPLTFFIYHEDYGLIYHPEEGGYKID